MNIFNALRYRSNKLKFLHKALILALMFQVPLWPSKDVVPQSNYKKIVGTVALFCAIAAAPIMSFIKQWRTPDKTLPTLSNLNIMTFNPFVDNGKSNNEALNAKQLDNLLRSNEKYEKPLSIEDKGTYQITRGCPKNLSGPITILSDGYPCHRRPLALYPYNLIKKGVVSGTVVYFSYPTDHNRKMFSYCQEQDIESLNLVIKEVTSNNPNTDVILYGLCKGGTTILRYLASKKIQNNEADIAQIKAAVIESPLVSIASNGAINSFVHTLIRWTHPNYNPNDPTILVDKEFPNIPIAIGHLPHDTIALDSDVMAIYNHIKTLKKEDSNQESPTTELITIYDKSIRHCRMPENKQYVEAVNKFVKENITRESK